MKKTKVMCISRKGNNKLKIYVDGQQVEQVSQFRYLGSLISRRMDIAQKRSAAELRRQRKYLWRKRKCLQVN